MSASNTKENRFQGSLDFREHVDLTEYWVMQVLGSWLVWDEFEWTWFGYSQLYDDLIEQWNEVPMPEIKKAVKQLKNDGFLGYGFTVNDEGMLAGSGYFLTKKGREAMP